MCKSAETSEPQIPPLTNAYHKTRRQLGLFSGLLIVWELIGIDLEENISGYINVTLKSPQAGPYVLIVLVLYFAFRLTIEWYQCDARRRSLFASRLDVVVALSIASFACALFFVQAGFNVQIADLDRSPLTRLGLAGAVLGAMVGFQIRLIRRLRREKLPAGGHIVLLGVWSALLLVPVFIAPISVPNLDEPLSVRLLVVLFSAGFAMIFGARYFDLLQHFSLLPGAPKQTGGQ
jgi:hypothetical protein